MGKMLELLHCAHRSGSLSDRQAFLEALYRENYASVLSITRRYFPRRAVDLASDVFTFKVIPMSLDRFIEAGSSLEAFIKRIAVNYCIDFARKRRLEQCILASGIKDWFRTDREYRRKQDGRLDPDFLACYLTPQQLRVVLLRFNEDLGFGEIQRQLNLPTEAAVRKHLSRARRNLEPAYTTCARSPQ